jgi:hypothetical protein
MRAQGQQQNGLGALVLYVLENDTQVETGAASPTTRQRTTQLVCPQGRMRGVRRQLLERVLDSRRRIGV